MSAKTKMLMLPKPSANPPVPRLIVSPADIYVGPEFMGIPVFVDSGVEPGAWYLVTKAPPKWPEEAP